jgi:hypothetical protein
MNRKFLLVLLLSLSACTQNEGPNTPTAPGASQPMGTPMQAPAAQSAAPSAAELEARLNTRYNSAVASCPGNTPAYNCSGILFRRVTYSPNHDFWGHSSNAMRLGSSTFSYIRNGVNSNSSDVTSGYILMDPDSARAAGKVELKARCIYPFMASTQSNNRAMHGCGFANRPSPDPLPADLSNCATLAEPAVTVAAWNKNFTEHGSDPINQCSLSTKVPAEFITSLAVRGSFPELTRTHGNEILFELWDTRTPEQLPIEAIFYNSTQEGSLVNAQALKHSYQVKTNIDLPIVRLDFGRGAKRFAVRTVDQEDGWTAAQRINARHADTTSECPGAKAAVYCSGVLARSLSYSTNYHAWNPNPNTQPIGGVSFSYLRGDVKTLATAGPKGQGMILRELNYASTAGLQAIQALCIYMADSNTWKRADHGCGVESASPGSEPCALQKPEVNTVETLKAHFLSVPASPAWRRLHHQCSLAIEPAPFMLAINGRQQIIAGTESNFYRYNEIMLAAWPMDIPTRLPIDAFYYVAGSEEGLRQAREIQKDLWRSADGMIKPVIRMDLTAAPTAVFSYQVADQAY